ncbi:hypothetical protein [Flammeovirga sp. OC4]|uniref:hypothetical protein n=1 Tax=Flammeovirga sp. OC4 TaxID=1382345 RepID=UPI0005C75623|nr:hypothetical protein [Flammeovirga sp. OC4]
MDFRKLTPAQTYMILKPIKSKNTDLMKYALLDLLYKEILELEQEWKYPHPRRRRESLFIYITRGKNFDQYIEKPHQDIFIQSFTSKNRRIQLRKLIKEALPLCSNGQGYKALQLIKEFKSYGIFNHAICVKDFNLFFLNSKGRSLRNTIKNTLYQHNEVLASEDLCNTKLSKIIKELGSNIFLLENFNNELVKKVDVNMRFEVKNVVDIEPDLELDTLFEVLSTPLFMNIDLIDSFSSIFDASYTTDFNNFDSSSDFSSDDFFDANGDY